MPKSVSSCPTHPDASGQSIDRRSRRGEGFGMIAVQTTQVVHETQKTDFSDPWDMTFCVTIRTGSFDAAGQEESVTSALKTNDRLGLPFPLP